MKRKILTAITFLFLLPFFPGVADAAAFSLETFMGGVRIRGEGVIDFSSPDRLAISFVLPREVHVTLQGDAARIVREALTGKRAEICAGVTATRLEKRPERIRIDFSHETRMVLTLEPETSAAGAYENDLHEASFTEKGRVLPFFCVMTKTRAAMFSTSLLPFGWIEMHRGKPGKITRVIPDTDAAILLQRLAKALAAGGLADYGEEGWAFSIK